MEVGFPEEIIQHIQSFMDGKDAARTTVASKHWYSAWLTRPNLDFDHRYFPLRSVKRDEFSESTNKVMQRYHDLNLSINSLRLLIDGDSSNLANSLIVKAMQLGATDLTIESSSNNRDVILDDVFVSETLTRLSVTACVFFPTKLNLPNLKSLYFSQVAVINPGFANLLASRCPSIEELTLKKFEYFADRLFCDGSLKNLHKLRKLKYLCMEGLVFDNTVCFDHFWSGFDCLKELVLWDCDGCRDLRIGSRTLERISIRCRSLQIVFDVPNIQKFHFESSELSSLKFKTTTATHGRKWESHIGINTCHYDIDRHRLVSEWRSLPWMTTLLDASAINGWFAST